MSTDRVAYKPTNKPTYRNTINTTVQTAFIRSNWIADSPAICTTKHTTRFTAVCTALANANSTTYILTLEPKIFRSVGTAMGRTK